MSTIVEESVKFIKLKLFKPTSLKGFQKYTFFFAFFSLLLAMLIRLKILEVLRKPVYADLRLWKNYTELHV